MGAATDSPMGATTDSPTPASADTASDSPRATPKPTQPPTSVSFSEAWVAGQNLLGLFIGHTDAAVYTATTSPKAKVGRIELPDGTVSWYTEMDANIYSAVETSAGAFAVPIDQSTLFAIDPPSGEVRWRKSTDAGSSSVSVAASDSRAVVAASADGTGTAVVFDAASGSRQRTITDLPRPDGIAIADGTLIYRGPFELRGYDLDSGDQRWTKGSIDGGAIVHEGVVYTVGESAVLGLDPASGETVWKHPLQSDVSFPTVRADGSTLLYTSDDSVHALDLSSGEQRWTATPRGTDFLQVEEPLVYASSFEGKLDVFAAETGEKVGTRTFDTSEMHVEGRRLLVSTIEVTGYAVEIER